MLRVAEHYAATDTGLQRRANEDSMLARSPLFVVADGMGGAQAGEVASRMAVEAFAEGGQDYSDPAAALTAVAQSANTSIYELAHKDASYAGMGTTVTAAYVGEEEVTVAHVGDSRAYSLRDGQLSRLTDDHSLVDELIRQGRLTPEEAEEHPQRSIITRALGPEHAVEVDVRAVKARPGDVYLLCSDGLTSMVAEQRLAEILRSKGRLRDAAAALIAEANRAGGRDNITVVLMRLEEVGVAAGERPPQEHTTVVGMRAPEPKTTEHAAATAATPEDAAAAPEHAAAAPEHAATARERAAAATALAELPSRSSSPAGEAHRRTPRAPGPERGSQAARRSRRSRRRRTALPLTLLAVLGALIAGAYLASQSVFFIGTDSNGLVSVFRGVPYVLPGGIQLYSIDYVSGVSASTLTSHRRSVLLNHALRSEKGAGELVRQLELGTLSGG